MSARLTFRFSALPPLLAVAALLAFVAWFVAERGATHRTSLHCAHETAWSCNVNEWRRGIHVSARTVAGAGRIKLEPRDDGGGDLMIGTQRVATFPMTEVSQVHQYALSLDRLANEPVAAEAVATIERPFDQGAWTWDGVKLTFLCLVVVALSVARVLIDVVIALCQRGGTFVPNPFATTIRRDGRAHLVLTLVSDYSKNF
jgi:hypothetical protein